MPPSAPAMAATAGAHGVISAGDIAVRAPSATRSVTIRSAIRNRMNQASIERSSRFGRAKRRRKTAMRDAEEHQDLEDVLHERVGVAGHAGQEHETRHEPRDDELDRADREDHESREDEDVEDAGVEVAEHPLLRERVLQRLHDPLGDAREPVLGAPGQQDPRPAATSSRRRRRSRRARGGRTRPGRAGRARRARWGGAASAGVLT